MSEVELKTKRNASATRTRILEAAKKCFAEHGYAATGIRDVAAEAGVSYTLLSRYFGSKAGLLEIVMTETLGGQQLFDCERAQFGNHLAHLLIDSERSRLPTAIAVLAAADPEGRKIATRVVGALVIEPLAQWLGPPNERQRAIAIAMLGAGFVTHRHLLPLTDKTAVVSQAEISLKQWLADSFQRIVDGSSGAGS